MGGRATTKTTRYGTDDVDVLFRRACERAQRGFFVSIDEIQKVPLDDISKICSAFQMASRKGCDVILVVAGLPYSFEPAIQHDGCTFLRRSVHEEIGLFTPEETKQAFREAFSQVKGLSLDEDASSLLLHASSGHPYMMQLLGYHLVEYLNGSVRGRAHTATRGDVDTILPVAMEAYERRALQPLVSSLSNGAQAYLRAMAQTVDENRIAETGAVAKLLGKSHQQLASTRQSLIDEGVIVSCGYGRVRFAIPYLRTYLGKAAPEHDSLPLLAQWDV